MQIVDVPLVPSGENKRVTDRNKKDFVNLATRRRALAGADQAMFSMRAGMADVIPKNLLSVLLPSEVCRSVSIERAIGRFRVVARTRDAAFSPSPDQGRREVELASPSRSDLNRFFHRESRTPGGNWQTDP